VSAHGHDRALLLLPTYGDVEHARRVALSRRGVGGLLDAPFATFTSLGERLLGEPVGALPSRAERDLLAGEALRQADVPCLGRVRDRKGIRARFLRLVKEMKQAGEEPSGLRARARRDAARLSAAGRERWEGFLDAWERYDALLLSAGVLDHEDVLRSLLRRLRDDPPEALARIAFLGADGFDDLTGLEEALLLAATRSVVENGGTALVTLTLDDVRADLFEPSRSLRDRLRGVGFEETRLDGAPRAPGVLAHLATALFGPPGPRVDAGTTVVERVGADPTDEVERIAREIRRLVDRERSDLSPRREGGGPLAFRDVGVVFRRLDAIGPVVRATFESLGVPTRLVGSGPALSSEALVRAFRGPLAVLAGDGVDGADLDAGRVLDWLRWRALCSRDATDVDLDLVDAADMAWRSGGFPSDWHGILAFREHPRWRSTLGALEVARSACASARGPDAVWSALSAAVETCLPLPPSGALDASGRPLDPEGDERCRRAANARRRLQDVGRGLLAAARRTGLFPDLDARTAVSQWTDALEQADASLPDRRLEAVTLLDAEEARHYELPVVFVAGLVEKEFPLQPRQDVFLHDDDRAALSAGEDAPVRLRTARADEDRERRLLLQAVTRARRRLYLCRHATDEDGREKAPSLLWGEVASVLARRTPDGATVPFGSAPGAVRRLEAGPEDALSVADVERFAAARLGEPAHPEAASARRVASALLRGGGARVASFVARAARFRRANEDALGPESLPAFERSVEEVSATGATTALECRHRFFLTHVAGVPRKDVPVGGLLFDRQELGKVVHEALRLALLRPDEPPASVASAALAAESVHGLPAGSAAWDAVHADVARVVTLFRRREEATRGSRFLPSPSWLEKELGGDDGAVVSLGEGEGAFRLKGRIDRVDVLEGEGGPAAVVVDYKLGKTTAASLVKASLDLENLQLWLYARAVEVASGVPVVGIEGYAASSSRREAAFDGRYAAAFAARREGKAGTPLSSIAFRALLADAERKASELVATIRHGGPGAHEKRPSKPEHCDRCDQRPVCRPDLFRFRERRP
jgi:RecB family exonuclease